VFAETSPKNRKINVAYEKFVYRQVPGAPIVAHCSCIPAQTKSSESVESRTKKKPKANQTAVRTARQSIRTTSLGKIGDGQSEATPQVYSTKGGKRRRTLSTKCTNSESAVQKGPDEPRVSPADSSLNRPAD